MRRYQKQLLMAFMALISFLTALSSSFWVQPANPNPTPPTWACLIAALSIIVGCASLAYTIYALYPLSAWRDDFPGTGARALEYLLKREPDYAGVIRSFVDAVKSGSIARNSDDYNCLVEDILGELPSRARKVNESRYRYFLGSLLLGVVTLVIVFAGFYIANYTLELSSWGSGYAGFKTSIPKGHWTNWVVEALYYSSVTFATLGYGDIVPETPWARLIALLEVATFITLFAIGLGFFLILVQQSDIDFRGLAETLRKKITHDVRQVVP